MTLNLRPATQEDVIIAAALLAETNGAFGVEVLGFGNPDLEISALQRWFADEGNRFSYQCTTIAEEFGMVTGLLLAFPGAKLSTLELGCARRLFSIYGLIGALKMVLLNRPPVGNKEAENDEYLIAHLAVDEHFRRRGIAQALLEKASQDAIASGLNKLVLEVEISNQKAIPLYRKSGFEIVNTVYYNDKAARFKSPGFYKMLKNL